MPDGSSRNQTLSFLLGRFSEAGIRPRTKLGQNFLVDLNLQRILLDTADLGSRDVVLEVGTGTASLTLLMAPKVAAMVTVELDRELFRLAAEELGRLDNVTMLQLDVLKNKNRLDPDVLEAVSRHLDAAPDRQFKLVANLPYNVATPIITNLLAGDLPPRSMTVTIQKELADRMVARPGSKDYGALSIWLQSQCRTEIVRVIPPSAFWPRPKVTSAIVKITLVDRLRERIGDRKRFHSFVRSMFFHRRKFLRSELLSVFKNRLAKPDIDEILSDLGLDGTMRAEQLDIETMLTLCETAHARLDG